MGKVIVMNAVTLDGVMQAPGRPDEDTRDGFAAHLEELLASWNARGGPFKDALNNTRKYVASSNPAARLDWPNSTLLPGDLSVAVADLKQSSSTNLVIMGSGVLIGSLMGAGLINQPQRRVRAAGAAQRARAC